MATVNLNARMSIAPASRSVAPIKPKSAPVKPNPVPTKPTIAAAMVAKSAVAVANKGVSASAPRQQIKATPIGKTPTIVDRPPVPVTRPVHSTTPGPKPTSPLSMISAAATGRTQCNRSQYWDGQKCAYIAIGATPPPSPAYTRPTNAMTMVGPSPSTMINPSVPAGFTMPPGPATPSPDPAPPGLTAFHADTLDNTSAGQDVPATVPTDMTVGATPWYKRPIVLGAFGLAVATYFIVR